ncbi:hypothetical protein TRFO_18795 [Tritrichomonas foetus]|uniref:Uncharacterized protein n=1 Tax=Tritrichomonas foetus TaxID=1144522 RepID=A0A1J4KPK3_9EUKA|nr:hypothetical protein TRFO_18795 [Tritrichomonas foetus]|eukprot:OHT11724.1 hypothetical protein TRFO_18795 [Tritrichomonas foetus]
MNQTDPDSLTTILGLSLDEKSDWEEPLQIFTQFLKYIRTNNPPLLPAPYSDLTDNFLYVSTPNILKKCLLYADCRNQSDLIIVEFLKEVISTASFSVTNKNTTQLIPVVCQIFDPVHAFYLHNGRIMNQQYSMHMTTLANYAIQNYIPFHLLQSFSNEDFKIEDF